MMLTPRGLGALPASYEDCHALMCRAFVGYQPTSEENWACSQLRGTFEGRTFSPLDCVTQAAALTVEEPTQEAPVEAKPLPDIVAASIAPSIDGMKFPPIRLVPNATEMRFGWRLNRNCYARQAEPALQADCQSPTWFYALLGLAAVAGLATAGKGKN